MPSQSIEGLGLTYSEEAAYNNAPEGSKLRVIAAIKASRVRKEAEAAEQARNPGKPLIPNEKGELQTGGTSGVIFISARDREYVERTANDPIVNARVIDALARRFHVSAEDIRAELYKDE